MKAFAKGTPVIVAEGLHKSYDDTEAVIDLSFEAWAGSVFALLGPNGAGKTTTINMLTTLLPIDRGRASVAGFDLTGQPEAVRQVIGLAGQAAAVDEKLTARENLEMFGRLYKIPKAERRARVEELIERFRMTDYADRTVGTYSGDSIEGSTWWPASLPILWRCSSTSRPRDLTPAAARSCGRRSAG